VQQTEFQHGGMKKVGVGRKFINGEDFANRNKPKSCSEDYVGRGRKRCIFGLNLEMCNEKSFNGE